MPPPTNYLIFLAACAAVAYTVDNMYTHPPLNNDLRCCTVYALLQRYAEHVLACLEPCVIPCETRRLLITLIHRELSVAHGRLFVEWWNPNTVKNHFLHIIQNQIRAELAERIAPCRLKLLLQIPS